VGAELPATAPYWDLWQLLIGRHSPVLMGGIFYLIAGAILDEHGLR